MSNAPQPVSELSELTRLLTPEELAVLEQIRSIRASGLPATFIVYVKQVRGIRIWRCKAPIEAG